MKYRICSFEVDTVNYSITESGKPVPVEPKVFDLLVYLITHRHKVIRRDELFEQIWQGREVSDTTLSNHIKSIRKLFGDDGETQGVIKTVRGRGYQFVASVSCTSEPSAQSNAQPPNPAKRVVRSPKPALVVCSMTLIMAVLTWFLLLSPSKVTELRPYVLVKPFGVSSANNEKWQPFADQMTREVIRKLAQISDVYVVPASSAFALDGRLSHEEIKKALPNANYVLDAMVNVNGQGRIRITADMLELESADLLWSEAFDSQLDDANFFTTQSEIASKVAYSLDVILGEQEKARLSEFPTSDLKAYELYVSGQQQLNLFTHRSLLSAIEYFDQAIARDKEFAGAYVAKADAYRIIMSYFAKPADILPEVVNSVQHALEQDPVSAEALSSMGLAYVLAWRWQEAWAMLTAAKKLNPDLALTELGFALYYAGLGDSIGVQQSLESASRIDPLNLEVADWGHWALTMVGELDLAVDWSKRHLQLHPDVGILSSGASVSASLTGDHERAIFLAERGVKLDPTAPYSYLALAQAFGHAGQTEQIPALLDKANAINSYLCPYETAVNYILLDDIDAAFEHLNAAVSARSNCLVFTRYDKRLAPLRKDPRFSALLTRIGLDDETISAYPTKQ